MPCPFTGPKKFCAGLKFLSQTKNLTASSKIFVPAQKNNFTECKSSYCLAQNICDCHNRVQNRRRAGNKHRAWKICQKE